MKHTGFALALALLPLGALAQDFDAGSMAAQRGDYATALQEWRPLAEDGDATAQFMLGQIYQAGLGLQQDDAEAVRWFRLAAEQGNAIAQTGLGLMYANGRGVPQDFVTAHIWLNIAAANGLGSGLTTRT